MELIPERAPIECGFWCKMHTHKKIVSNRPVLCVRSEQHYSIPHYHTAAQKQEERSVA